MQHPVSTIKALSMLHSSLLVGQILFGVIAFYLVYSSNVTPVFINPEVVIIIHSGAIGIAVAFIIASFTLYKKKVEKICSNAEPVQKKLASYHTASLIRWAILESSALLCIVCFILTGRYSLLLLSGIVLLYFIYIKPSTKKIMQELGISHEEVNE